MKKLFIIFLFFYSGAHSQVHFGMGAGSDFKHGVANINVGYETSNYLVLEAEMQPSLTRDASAHNYFGAKAGYAIELDNGAKGAFAIFQTPQIIPSVGYYFDYVSADNTSLNSWRTGYSIKIVAPINDQLGGLFTNIMYIHKQVELVVGVHIEL